HAGSQGRSQTRPKIPGNTFDSRFNMYASPKRPSAIRRMYSGTSVWAGHAHWQSTTRWKNSPAVLVGSIGGNAWPGDGSSVRCDQRRQATFTGMSRRKRPGSEEPRALPYESLNAGIGRSRTSRSTLVSQVI